MKEENEIDNSLKMLARSSVIVFMGFVLSKLFTYIYRILIARNFGAEAYGTFTIAVMVIGWLTIFSTLGLSQGIVRYIALYRGKKKTSLLRFIFQDSLKKTFLLGLILGTLLFIFAEKISIGIFDNQELTIFLKAFSILIPLTALFKIFLSTIQAYEKIGWFSFIFNIFQNLMKVAILGILIILGVNSNSVIISYILGIAAAVFVSYLVVSSVLSPKVFGEQKIKPEKKKSTAKELLNYSWPLMFLGIVTSMMGWIDTLILGIFRSAEEVGFYNAAMPIAMLLGLVPSLFTDLFLPLITREYAKKRYSIIKQLSQQVGKWIFVINLPLFILMALFPGAFLNILFGAEFLVAEQALRILAIGYLFQSVFTVSYRLLIISGKTKLTLIDILVVSFLNVLLNIYLVPRFGINGAALGTSVSFILLNILFVVQSRKYLRIIPVRRKMLGILLISLIPTGAILLIRESLGSPGLFSLALLTAFFILSYLALILLINGFDKNDLTVLMAFKNKGQNLIGSIRS